jgi:hypothetical protein
LCDTLTHNIDEFCLYERGTWLEYLLESFESPGGKSHKDWRLTQFERFSDTFTPPPSLLNCLVDDLLGLLHDGQVNDVSLQTRVAGILQDLLVPRYAVSEARREWRAKEIERFIDPGIVIPALADRFRGIATEIKALELAPESDDESESDAGSESMEIE